MKRISFLFFCFFVGILSVSAKEFNFYFYPNGGKVKTSGFELSDYGYLSYNGNFYANYSEKVTIKKINSISGVPFQLEKNGTSLVNGREWYTQVDGKTYFFSISKSYKMQDVLKVMGINDEFYSFDLYANWNDKKKTSGIDISSGKAISTSSTKKATSFTIYASKNQIKVGESISLTTTFKPSESSKESITWSSSNTKVATVNSSGKVVGVSTGTVTITGKSKSGLKSSVRITITKNKYTVTIKYHANGGSLARKHDPHISIKSGYVYYDNHYATHSIEYNKYMIQEGLVNYNNSGWININKDGFIVKNGAEWNTKPDGSGKSYNQETVYKASDFCNASKKDCTVVLYVNWVYPQTNYKVTIKYHANGGTLFSNAHGKNFYINNQFIYNNQTLATTSVKYGQLLPNSGLMDCNNRDALNLIKSGYYLEYGNEWNTKPDGSGKSYSQYTDYNSGVFCKATKKDCIITLYANWRKSVDSRQFYLGTVELSKSKYVVVPHDGDIKYAQGFSVAGNYYIAAKRDSNEKKANIYAINTDSGKVVRKFYKENYWGHGNAIAYQTNTKQVYVSMTTNKKVKVFPYSDIGSGILHLTEKSLTINNNRYNPTGLAYDSSNNLFYAVSGWNVSIYDSNLNRKISGFRKQFKEIAQDIGAYHGLVLIVRWSPRASVDGKGTGKVDLTNVKNAIDVYRASDGLYRGTYIVNSDGELESVSYNPKKNCFSLYIQNSGESRIYDVLLPGINQIK